MLFCCADDACQRMPRRIPVLSPHDACDDHACVVALSFYRHAHGACYMFCQWLPLHSVTGGPCSCQDIQTEHSTWACMHSPFSCSSHKLVAANRTADHLKAAGPVKASLAKHLHFHDWNVSIASTTYSDGSATNHVATNGVGRVWVATTLRQGLRWRPPLCSITSLLILMKPCC